MPSWKSLFETSRKTAVTVACILVMLVTLGTATVFAANALSQSSVIGEDAAASAAFADAGVDPAFVTGLRVELDREEGRPVYEVEFGFDGAEYEYHIDAGDGSVVKKEKELHSVLPGGQPGGMTPSKELEDARAIALADAGVDAADAVFTEAELDVDNGLWVYEFQFRAGDGWYEYEINANTGAVYSKVVETYVRPSPAPVQIAAPESTPQPAVTQAPPAQPDATAPPVWSHHPDDHDDDYDDGHHYDDHDYDDSGHHYDDHRTGTPSAAVGLEEAKAAALADAGLSVDEVTFTKTEQDREDGSLIYEIEFYTAAHEYEYEIDAATGRIYSRSVETLQTSLPSAAPSAAPSGGSTYIGIERARSIALDHAGLTSSQAIVTKSSMDRDDGHAVYEIEFRQGRAEYEYKIDAQTGDILEFEHEED